MKYKIHIIIFALVVLIGNLIWELWPEKVSTRTVNYDPPVSFESYSQVCDNLELFWTGSWNLTYQSRIESDQQTEIILIYEPGAQEESITSQRKCELVIDTYLEIPNYEIEPGAQFITPYLKFENIQFKWTVLPSDQDINGVLWVSVNVVTGDDQPERIPMFALPINIQKSAFLSIPPRIIRIVFIFGSLVTLGLCFIINE